MTERRQGSQAHGPLVSLLVMATPLAWTALICAGVYYGMGLRRPAPVQESTQDLTRCVLVSPANAADVRGWERNLYDWAALRDPTLLVLPNERFGFSRERAIKREVPCAPVPPYRFTMAPMGQTPPPPVPLCGPPAPLPARVAAAGEPIRPAPVEPVVVEPLPRGVFWRTLDGRLLSGLPAFADRQVQDAIAQGGAPKAPTSLRVSRGDRGSTLRVQVVDGSGNAGLDALAVVALRRAVGQLETEERLAPQGRARSELLPPAGGAVDLQVEWSLPVDAVATPPGRADGKR